jgi:hypothetical protein
MADSPREPASEPAEPGGQPPAAGHRPSADQPWSPFPRPQSWLERRREKIAEEIARNRRGEYTVPTWVLATALGLILAAWALLIIVS